MYKEKDKEIKEYYTTKEPIHIENDKQYLEFVKGPWTEQEDNIVIKLVSENGAQKWTHISKHLPGRIGKQCRERWYNHLNPRIKKIEWSSEEEWILFLFHKNHGNKWAEMTQVLEGRTDNSIKNHWNSSMRKKIPELNKLYENYLTQNNKPQTEIDQELMQRYINQNKKQSKNYFDERDKEMKEKLKELSKISLEELEGKAHTDIMKCIPRKRTTYEKLPQNISMPFIIERTEHNVPTPIESDQSNFADSPLEAQANSTHIDYNPNYSLHCNDSLDFLEFSTPPPKKYCAKEIEYQSNEYRNSGLQPVFYPFESATGNQLKYMHNNTVKYSEFMDFSAIFQVPTNLILTDFEERYKTTEENGIVFG